MSVEEEEEVTREDAMDAMDAMEDKEEEGEAVELRLKQLTDTQRSSSVEAQQEEETDAVVPIEDPMEVDSADLEDEAPKRKRKMKVRTKQQPLRSVRLSASASPQADVQIYGQEEETEAHIHLSDNSDSKPVRRSSRRMRRVAEKEQETLAVGSDEEEKSAKKTKRAKKTKKNKKTRKSKRRDAHESEDEEAEKQQQQSEEEQEEEDEEKEKEKGAGEEYEIVEEEAEEVSSNAPSASDSDAKPSRRRKGEKGKKKKKRSKALTLKTSKAKAKKSRKKKQKTQEEEEEEEEGQEHTEGQQTPLEELVGRMKSLFCSKPKWDHAKQLLMKGETEVLAEEHGDDKLNTGLRWLTRQAYIWKQHLSLLRQTEGKTEASFSADSIEQIKVSTLSESCFLFIGDKSDRATWRLPYREASGLVNVHLLWQAKETLKAAQKLDLSLPAALATDVEWWLQQAVRAGVLQRTDRKPVLRRKKVKSTQGDQFIHDSEEEKESRQSKIERLRQKFLSNRSGAPTNVSGSDQSGSDSSSDSDSSDSSSDGSSSSSGSGSDSDSSQSDSGEEDEEERLIRKAKQQEEEEEEAKAQLEAEAQAQAAPAEDANGDIDAKMASLETDGQAEGEGEGEAEGEEERAERKRRKKEKKEKKKKKEKKRKNRLDVSDIHSESQRLLRETLADEFDSAPVTVQPSAHRKNLSSLLSKIQNRQQQITAPTYKAAFRPEAPIHASAQVAPMETEPTVDSVQEAIPVESKEEQYWRLATEDVDMSATDLMRKMASLAKAETEKPPVENVTSTVMQPVADVASGKTVEPVEEPILASFVEPVSSVNQVTSKPEIALKPAVVELDLDEVELEIIPPTVAHLPVKPPVQMQTAETSRSISRSALRKELKKALRKPLVATVAPSVTVDNGPKEDEEEETLTVTEDARGAACNDDQDYFGEEDQDDDIDVLPPTQVVKPTAATTVSTDADKQKLLNFAKNRTFSLPPLQAHLSTVSTGSFSHSLQCPIEDSQEVWRDSQSQLDSESAPVNQAPSSHVQLIMDENAVDFSFPQTQSDSDQAESTIPEQGVIEPIQQESAPVSVNQKPTKKVEPKKGSIMSFFANAAGQQTATKPLTFKEDVAPTAKAASTGVKSRAELMKKRPKSFIHDGSDSSMSEGEPGEEEERSVSVAAPPKRPEDALAQLRQSAIFDDEEESEDDKETHRKNKTHTNTAPTAPTAAPTAAAAAGEKDKQVPRERAMSTSQQEQEHGVTGIPRVHKERLAVVRPDMPELPADLDQLDDEQIDALLNEDGAGKKQLIKSFFENEAEESEDEGGMGKQKGGVRDPNAADEEDNSDDDIGYLPDLVTTKQVKETRKQKKLLQKYHNKILDEKDEEELKLWKENVEKGNYSFRRTRKRLRDNWLDTIEKEDEEREKRQKAEAEGRELEVTDSDLDIEDDISVDRYSIYSDPEDDRDEIADGWYEDPEDPLDGVDRKNKRFPRHYAEGQKVKRLKSSLSDSLFDTMDMSFGGDDDSDMDEEEKKRRERLREKAKMRRLLQEQAKKTRFFEEDEASRDILMKIDKTNIAVTVNKPTTALFTAGPAAPLEKVIPLSRKGSFLSRSVEERARLTSLHRSKSSVPLLFSSSSKQFVFRTDESRDGVSRDVPDEHSVDTSIPSKSYQSSQPRPSKQPIDFRSSALFSFAKNRAKDNSTRQ